ncbi:hypothetical protein ACLKA7_000091, partial [Drosophila subpalustris]
MPGQEA